MPFFIKEKRRGTSLWHDFFFQHMINLRCSLLDSVALRLQFVLAAFSAVRLLIHYDLLWFIINLIFVDA